ncbi:hypothetical protein [Pragia fontium]|uniref:Uncharacterized protein n=2 Tax=Pragia fontium TaxID=82985 RepID=A0AAJ4WDG1_9GAMM|nr:hypothetical protein [Pragia fontium]AKJ42306.1 hypothetical protein QQ39_09595 [Pragia fontium]SFD41570.1 hypothetical protein SAMN02745723_11720 [Pragia fontium DSM 5563 = ATCC 49100]SUB82587.1 Uncharacterised protein [Pragia fontium]VEJ55487.1 Uncharacterised protein [Pragia fontium]GKX61613.1 hypothetical protein SOASR032_01820 [Pragia fontium]
MKNKIARAYLLVLTLASLALVGYYGYMLYQKDNFSCDGRFYIKNNRDVLDLNVHYRFNAGVGLVESQGEFIPYNGEPARPIKIHIKFSYHQDGDKMFLISENTNPNQQDITLLNQLLPDFFLIRNRGINMHIYPQGQEGYVFSGDKIPYFLCLKD